MRRSTPPRSRPVPAIRSPGHRNAGRRPRREAERVGEVEVEGDQGPTGLDCSGQDNVVGGALKALVVNCVDIVAGVAEELRPAQTEVLVELELHATSMNRPLASRAP